MPSLLCHTLYKISQYLPQCITVNTNLCNHTNIRAVLKTFQNNILIILNLTCCIDVTIPQDVLYDAVMASQNNLSLALFECCQVVAVGIVVGQNKTDWTYYTSMAHYIDTQLNT